MVVLVNGIYIFMGKEREYVGVVSWKGMESTRDKERERERDVYG